MNDSFRTRFGRHVARILPRVAIIGVVFVGLNWWVTSQKQAQTTETGEKQTIASAWDDDLLREPGVAIAILLDEHKPASVDEKMFEKWRIHARQFITDYHGEIVKIAGTHDQLKVRVGLYHTAAGAPAVNTYQEMSPPSLADLRDALSEDRWTVQTDDYDEALRQAIRGLSQAGLASTTVLLVRHPEHVEYLALSMLRNSLAMSAELGLPTLPKGPYLMLVSYDPDAQSPAGYPLKWFVQQTFPMLSIDVPRKDFVSPAPSGS